MEQVEWARDAGVPPSETPIGDPPDDDFDDEDEDEEEEDDDEEPLQAVRP